MKKKRKPWSPENDWKGYIRDTWLIWLIMIVCYVAFCAAGILWLDDEITFLQALIYGGPAFVLFNIGLVGTAHYYREHFGMNDRKIDAFIEDMKERNKEQAKRESSQEPEDLDKKGGNP